MQIIIDTREHHKDYIRERLEKKDLEVEIAKLNHGDFLLTESLAYIERKTTLDLLRSMSNLDLRLAKLKELSPFPTLMVEGVLRYNHLSGRLLRREGSTYLESFWSIDAYNSYLLSLMIKGILVVQTESLEHTIDMLASMCRYFTKPSHMPLFHSLLNPQLSCLRCFPDVGENLAKDILSRFSLREIVEDPERLMEIRRIGRDKVERIRKFLNYRQEEKKERN